MDYRRNGQLEWLSRAGIRLASGLRQAAALFKAIGIPVDTVRVRGAPSHATWSDAAVAAREREEILAGLRVDFLIPQSPNARGGGTIQSLERDFAAVITPGLEFAFQDFEVVRLSGLTARDEKADRDIWVCGPAAFVLLKARALRQRGENKDAYDLHYVLGHWREGLDDIVRRMRSLEPRAVVIETLGFLEEDFRSVDGIGPARIDRFLGKDTYREPGWVDATGNNEFQVYVEDHGTPGAGLASGVYLYRMTTPGFTDTRRMVLLK